MIGPLLGVTTLIYTVISVEYFQNHQYGLSMSFFLYGLANLALYFSGRGW